MNSKKQLTKYLISDFLAGGISWTLFYIFRKLVIESQKFGEQIPIHIGLRFFIGLTVLPVFWIIIYYASGYYNDVFRKSRLSELAITILSTLFGAVLLFFMVMLDDTIQSYRDYYLSFSYFIAIHFVLTYIPRLNITTRTTHKIHSGVWGFNTLLIGSNGKAGNIYKEVTGQRKSSGHKFVGFVNVIKREQYSLQGILPHLGSIDDLKSIIEKHDIKECIIALDSKEQDKIGMIMAKLSDVDVLIKAIPNMLDIITGKVRTGNVFGAPLIEITHDLMPRWQTAVKEFMDITFSILAVLIASPLFLFLAVGVKLSSPGPIFYTHQRIGRFGKPFHIIKFRSMVTDAEKNGPELSSKEDPRITKFGSFMRRYRFDELPNFFNVLKGEMSLVGPRPERQYFIDKIVEKAPHYKRLSKIKPGITSWGQVSFGYAESVEEMIQRMKYDLLYLENMSIYMDIKILIYTTLTILRAKGV